MLSSKPFQEADCFSAERYCLLPLPSTVRYGEPEQTRNFYIVGHCPKGVYKGFHLWNELNVLAETMILLTIILRHLFRRVITVEIKHNFAYFEIKHILAFAQSYA